MAIHVNIIFNCTIQNKATYYGSILFNPFCSLHWLLIATIMHARREKKRERNDFSFVFEFKSTKHNWNMRVACMLEVHESTFTFYLFISSFETDTVLIFIWKLDIHTYESRNRELSTIFIEISNSHFIQNNVFSSIMCYNSPTISTSGEQ